MALLDTTTSAALFRYASKLITVLVLAGTVIVARGTELVLVAEAAVDVLDGPTTVTITVTV